MKILINRVINSLIDSNIIEYCIGQSIILTGLLSTVIQFIQDSGISIFSSLTN